MATNHGHGNDADGNPGVGFDKSDLSAKAILIFFFVLATAAVAIHLVVLGLYIGMTKVAQQHEVESSPLAPQTYTPRDGILTNTANVNVQQFPQPRLLHHIGGIGEMTRFLRVETTVLTAKPWRDEQGNVHLPIDQAMREVVTRLPVRAGGTAPPNYPGASREYAYPAAPDEAAAGQSTAGQSAATPEPVTPGETGASSAAK